MAQPQYEKDEANLGGRPVLFKDKDELQAKIDEYYVWAKENKKPLTIERLAVFLDCDRWTINCYSHKDDFSHTIKKARDYILADKTERLNSGPHVTGVIFDLKNNHGFTDAKQIDMNANVRTEAKIDLTKLTDEQKEELLKEKLNGK